MAQSKFIPKSDLPQILGVTRQTVYNWVKRIGGVLFDEYKKVRLLSPRLFAQIKEKLAFD